MTAGASRTALNLPPNTRRPPRPACSAVWAPRRRSWLRQRGSLLDAKGGRSSVRFDKRDELAGPLMDARSAQWSASLTVKRYIQLFCNVRGGDEEDRKLSHTLRTVRGRLPKGRTTLADRLSVSRIGLKGNHGVPGAGQDSEIGVVRLLHSAQKESACRPQPKERRQGSDCPTPHAPRCQTVYSAPISDPSWTGQVRQLCQIN
jgi:hypothetical protein